MFFQFRQDLPGGIPDNPHFNGMIFMKDKISERSDFVPWVIVLFKSSRIYPVDRSFRSPRSILLNTAWSMAM
jgi:hypothetical protein